MATGSNVGLTGRAQASMSFIKVDSRLHSA
jgi:hypothetical protein